MSDLETLPESVRVDVREPENDNASACKDNEPPEVCSYDLAPAARTDITMTVP
jgi:hypothetical protein